MSQFIIDRLVMEREHLLHMPGLNRRNDPDVVARIAEIDALLAAEADKAAAVQDAIAEDQREISFAAAHLRRPW